MGRSGPRRAPSSVWSHGDFRAFEFSHFFGENPQGFIELDVRVDGLHFAGRVTASGCRASCQAAFQDVLLHLVEGVPQVRLIGVFATARLQELVRADRRGLDDAAVVDVVVFEGKGRLCEGHGFGEEQRRRSSF